MKTDFDLIDECSFQYLADQRWAETQLASVRELQSDLFKELSNTKNKEREIEIRNLLSDVYDEIDYLVKML